MRFYNCKGYLSTRLCTRARTHKRLGFFCGNLWYLLNDYCPSKKFCMLVGTPFLPAKSRLSQDWRFASCVSLDYISTHRPFFTEFFFFIYFLSEYDPQVLRELSVGCPSYRVFVFVTSCRPFLTRDTLQTRFVKSLVLQRWSRHSRKFAVEVNVGVLYPNYSRT